MSANGAKAPDNNLTLKWAHGFRSFDTRNNLKYTMSGNIVFTTAGVGVVYNKNTQEQSFFNMHKEDIVAMALHPDGDIVATGQMAAKALGPERSNTKINQGAKGREALQEGKLVDIYIWKASTKEVITKIRGFHRRAVRQLQFSPSGQRLLSIGEDDHHSVAVYDWANNAVLGTAKVDPDKVFDAAWKDENVFATCGVKHLKVFTLNGSNLNGQKGSYAQVCGMIAMTCCSYVANGVLLTGAQDGGLIKWAGTSASKPVKKHTDAIWCIQKGTDGTTFWTGGNDAKLICWNASSF